MFVHIASIWLGSITVKVHDQFMFLKRESSTPKNQPTELALYPYVPTFLRRTIFSIELSWGIIPKPVCEGTRNSISPFTNFLTKHTQTLSTSNSKNRCGVTQFKTIKNNEKFGLFLILFIYVRIICRLMICIGEMSLLT